MKFTTATIAAASLALVSAAPCGTTAEDTQINDGDVFRVMSIRSGANIQYASVQAANKGLYLNLPSQDATCSKEDVNYASFRLSSGALYLNTADTTQQLFLDRSGNGQGVIQYTTGDENAPTNSERTGFAIDENSNLVFRSGGVDSGFQACPGATGYSIWLNGVTNPAGNTGCIEFLARASKETDPVTCTYTS